LTKFNASLCAAVQYAVKIRVVNGPHFEARTQVEPKITSLSSVFILESRFRPESQIYQVSQNVQLRDTNSVPNKL